MPNFLSRLGLVNGAVLRLGQKWFDDDEYAVGLICERPETFEPIESDDGPQATEKTPAHFEVWLLPPVLYEQLWTYYRGVYEALVKWPHKFDEIWEKADQSIAMLATEQGDMKLTCRRVYIEHVAFSEESLKFSEAYSTLHNFFAEKVELPEQDEDKPPVKLVKPEAKAGVTNGPDAG